MEIKKGLIKRKRRSLTEQNQFCQTERMYFKRGSFLKQVFDALERMSKIKGLILKTITFQKKECVVKRTGF